MEKEILSFVSKLFATLCRQRTKQKIENREKLGWAEKKNMSRQKEERKNLILQFQLIYKPCLKLITAWKISKYHCEGEQFVDIENVGKYQYMRLGCEGRGEVKETLY
jgi:hypothetical protein